MGLQADGVNEAVCWQCGAPADPGFAYVKKLNARASLYKDGEGFEVTRGRWTDTVHVRIPRCENCRTRNQILAVLIFVEFMGGAVIGGMDYPSRGWTTILGAVAGVLPVGLGSFLWDRWAGRRRNAAFPALKRLRKAGWSEPD